MHDRRATAVGGRLGAPLTPLPDMRGVTFDLCRVAGFRRRVTGDAWSDAFAVGERRVVIAVGDTIEPHAAADLQRKLRATMGSASAALKPAAHLRAAAGILRARCSTPSTTGLVAVVDLAAETLTYQTSGSRAPYVRYHDGRVAALPGAPAPQTLIPDDCPPAHVTVDLRGAQLLVFYTRGLMQSPVAAPGGPARLAQVLEDDRLDGCPHPAAWVARRVLPGELHGDVAVLTLAFPPRAGDPRAGSAPRWTAAWSFEATAASSNAARTAFAACLRSKDDGHAVDLLASELIFGELLGNVVRHAPGIVDVVLDWTGELPVLNVKDNGPGYRSRRARERLPIDDLSESGRGLFIISACAAHFSVRNRQSRGAHATATLPPATLPLGTGAGSAGAKEPPGNVRTS